MNNNKWIAHESVNPENKTNLLCFIFDGGSASYFAPWKYKISNEINLIPILYPTREKRRNESMYVNMNAFVKDLVESLADIFKGEYSFFGYCSGSVIAYEAAILAKKLYGTEPKYSMIVSSEAPKYLCESVPVITDKNREKLFFDHMSGLPFVNEKTLKDKVFLDYYKPLFTADYGLLNTYSYEKGEELGCDFDVIMCPDDPKVERKKVEAWGELTTGKTNIIEKDGGHFLVDAQAEYIFATLNGRLSGRTEPDSNVYKDVSKYKNADFKATDTEQKIIEIWKETFERDDFYPSDHFFLKGGDSLKAVRIVHAIKIEFGVDVNINDIFNNPEIFEFAKLVSDLAEKKEDETGHDTDEGEI